MEQWEALTQKTPEKSMKLKDLDVWLGGAKSLLNTDDSGKDLASVQNLAKKHQADRGRHPEP